MLGRKGTTWNHFKVHGGAWSLRCFHQSTSVVCNRIQSKLGFPDAGASRHMTPHRHWIRNSIPHCIEVKLADGSSIYSQGKGTVLFEPIIDGQVAQIVEFSDVLYVPDLRNNLFSVLHLSLHKRFTVTIEGDTMDFRRDDITFFEAKVNGSTTLPISRAPPSPYQKLPTSPLPPPFPWTWNSGIVVSAILATLSSRG
jgi:hypothetical protein